MRFLLSMVPQDPEGGVDRVWAIGIGALGAAWGWCQAHVIPMYTHLAATIHITAILALWTIDMIVGILSDMHAHHTWRAFSRDKAYQGMMRLIWLWCPYMFVCYVLQMSQIIGAPLFAGSLELYALTALARSVLKNLARNSGDVEMEQALTVGDQLKAGFKSAAVDRHAIANTSSQAQEKILEEVKAIQPTIIVEEKKPDA